MQRTKRKQSNHNKNKKNKNITKLTKKTVILKIIYTQYNNINIFIKILIIYFKIFLYKLSPA